MSKRRMSHGGRARQIVKMAAEKVKNDYTREWLRRDEAGTWEVMADDLLDEKADKIRELGLTEEAANQQIATYIAYLAVEALIFNKKKRGRR